MLWPALGFVCLFLPTVQNYKMSVVPHYSSTVNVICLDSARYRRGCKRAALRWTSTLGQVPVRSLCGVQLTVLRSFPPSAYISLHVEDRWWWSSQAYIIYCAVRQFIMGSVLWASGGSRSQRPWWKHQLAVRHWLMDLECLKRKSWIDYWAQWHKFHLKTRTTVVLAPHCRPFQLSVH